MRLYECLLAGAREVVACCLFNGWQQNCVTIGAYSIARDLHKLGGHDSEC